MTTTTNQPRSWRVGVMTPGDRDWCFNMRRFATAEEAETYGRDLAWRWTAVTEWQVMPSEDDPE